MKLTPGLYELVPEDVYHADPVPGGSLSSTGARRILPPEGCPAKFRHELDHGQPPKKAWDLGRVAHRELLGIGGDIVVIDAPSYTSRAARQQRDEAREAGATPLLAHEYAQVQDMIRAVRAHPLAGPLFEPGRGRPEVTLVWQDPATRVMCRARIDWLVERNGRVYAIDYKTATSVAPDALQKAMHDYGYYMQAAWYLDGIRALGLDDRPQFVFVAQETAAPHLITAFQPDHVAMRIGAGRNADARHLYARCMKTGEWPAYVDDIELIPLPAWAENRYQEVNLT